MANELKLKVDFAFSKGGTVFEPDKLVDSIDVSGTQALHYRQSVGTSEEAIELGELSTGGYGLFVNRDDTNYISIRSGTADTDLVRLNAGEMALFRVHGDSSAPFAIADTAACAMEYWLLPT